MWPMTETGHCTQTGQEHNRVPLTAIGHGCRLKEKRDRHELMAPHGHADQRASLAESGQVAESGLPAPSSCQPRPDSSEEVPSFRRTKPSKAQHT